MPHLYTLVHLKHSIPDCETPFRNLIFTGRDEAVLNAIFVLTDFMHLFGFEQETGVRLSFCLVKDSCLSPHIERKVSSTYLLLPLLEEDVALARDILGFVITPGFVCLQ